MIYAAIFIIGAVTGIFIVDLIKYSYIAQLRRRISAILQRRFDNAFIVEQSPEKSSLYAELIDLWNELHL